ncbi:hypothetical protein GCM10010270_29230 [Streptomyces violaceus]|nr:hypothetical protein GCM10010270_29230 [Streptomyces janthinus]
MHKLLVPPVDSVDHPAGRHLTTALGTALSGSVVIGAFLRLGSARRVAPLGRRVGDDAPHQGTAGLFTCVEPPAGGRGRVGAMGFPHMSAGSIC